MSRDEEVLTGIQIKILLAAKVLDAGGPKDDVLGHLVEALDLLAGLPRPAERSAG